MSGDGLDEVDVRTDPDSYEIGRGSEGAFRFQPYKDELLAHWTVAEFASARRGAERIYGRFLAYVAADDFPGADMARKYLRLGFTRAMRYAKYPGGRKYDDDGTERDPRQWHDTEKRAVAQVYRHYWALARTDERYERLREKYRQRHE
ncbi:MAG: DUF4385 family protein [Halobacteriales archaeon]